MENTTKGKLSYMIHSYNESRFNKTVLYIEERGNSSAQYFYGYVPETMLGREVSLFQQKGENGLYQKLTNMNEDNTYQVEAWSKN